MLVAAAALHPISEKARICELETRLAESERKYERLQLAYQRLAEHLKLLEKRLFVAKAERAAENAGQLAFDSLLVEAKRIASELAESDKDEEAVPSPSDLGTENNAGTGKDEGKGGKPKRRKPSGRRNLAESDLPTVSVEITNPELEDKFKRIGWEETYRLGFQRGGHRRILIRRAVYKIGQGVDRVPCWEGLQAKCGKCGGTAVGHCQNSAVGSCIRAQMCVTETGRGECATTADGHCHASAVGSCAGAPMYETETAGKCAEQTFLPSKQAESSESPPTRIVKADMPREIVRRGLLAPSAIAHILVSKYLLGVPFYRLEQQWALEGEPLDRSTMCRYAEEVGGALGSIVEAMHKEALKTAFCLSTDATGICIQPEPMSERQERKRRACQRGHFFVVLADRDHVFFEYQPKHTSAAVCGMFRGFQGYVQADAHTVYDALFRGDGLISTPDGKPIGPPPKEVACWSHCRRKFWEAATCKHKEGVEGLRRVDLIFAADRLLADLPPVKRKVRREVVVRPLVDSFFAWVKEQRHVRRERGLVAKALGYASNHEQALCRFFDDGRLRLTNNDAERALRPIAAARKLFMFFGSDDHASSAANLFSLIASCKLHRLDPQGYLEDVIRVLPYWPRDRHLELAPRYWGRTRSRLDPAELALPLGHITVPPPLPAEEQSAST